MACIKVKGLREATTFPKNDPVHQHCLQKANVQSVLKIPGHTHTSIGKQLQVYQLYS